VLRSFRDIPEHVRRRVVGGEPVLLIMLDAFGRVFLERHLDHPLIRRLTVTDLASQFPSTTTAHVSTLHFGLPVEQHGLYEWAVYEPSLDQIINPLPFRIAGDDGREGLSGRLDPRRLLDAPTFYETLGVPARVAQPSGIVESTYSRLACAGAARAGIEDLSAGVAQLIAGLSAEEIGYGHLYWPDIDTASHLWGPESPEVRAASLHALDAIEAALANAPGGVTVMLTADHGHTAVSPDRVDLLDEVWPELTAHLSQPRPAGSARVPFLHLRDGSASQVIEELSARLDGRALVRPAREMFDTVGPRLAARLGDVVVLPTAGRSAWLASAPTHVLTHLGSHGGCTEAETATYLAELRT
jgi:hypothetical protein